MEQVQYQAKNWMPVTIRIPNLQTLKQTAKQIRGPWQRVLEEKYGKILGLLEVEVQPHALAVLAQFYDVRLRCFTFKDFQLAPALEEYERILSMPIKEPAIYFHKGYFPSWGAMAELLKRPEVEVRQAKRARNGIEGLPREYLEEVLAQHREAKNWQAVIDTLALMVYEIVLFPQLEDYVDLAAVDVLLAVKEKNENHVPTILADTYYTLNCCLSRRGKNLRWCIHALYLWMTTHCCPGRCKTGCPVEDYKWGCVRMMPGEEWIHLFMGLTESAIEWYPKWNERETFIARCGKSPNVPLMGTQGCSNYNPVLALRQNGYPMLAPPTEESLTLLEVPGRDMQNAEWFRKIRQAWKQVVRAGPEGGPRSYGASSSYKRWLQQQMKINGLPFERVQDPRTRLPFETSEPSITKELEEALKHADAERKSLKRKLTQATSLQLETQEQVLKERRLGEQARQEAEKERELRRKMGDCLKAADQEMCLQRKEKDQAATERESLKEALQNARRKEEAAEAREHQALERLAAERQEARSKKERARAIVVELRDKITRKDSRHRELIEQAEQRVEAIEEMTEHWKDRHDKVVWLANRNNTRITTIASHRYGTCAKTKQMENMVEALEQRNEELRSKLAQIKEQMAKVSEFLARGPPQVQNTTNYPPGYTPPPPWNTQEEQPPPNENNPNVPISRVGSQGQNGRTTVTSAQNQRDTPEVEERWRFLEERLRIVEGADKYGLDAVDLCLVPDVILPVDFKTPDFDKYKGSSYPRTHLAM
ncbi:hypothetical protein CR513_51134, partial [Mucuna pruriens]